MPREVVPLGTDVSVPTNTVDGRPLGDRRGEQIVKVDTYLADTAS